MNNTVGIIGFGFVGRAVAHGFGPVTKVIYHDPAYPESESFENVIHTAGFVFVGVPTPMQDIDGGKIDSTILDGVIQKIHKTIEFKRIAEWDWEQPVIIIKSTVTPDVLMQYQQQYPNMRLVFSPEFLTERTAYLDFINATRIILGGKREDTEAAERLHRLRFEHTPIYHCDMIAASLVKYMCNAFFSVKVSFMNEMRAVALKSGSETSWKEIVAMFLADQRIGNSHYQVPGPDGRLGFGGKCLPKDLNAITHYSKALGVDVNTLEAAWKTNQEVRLEKDWGKIKGAVTEKIEKKQ